MNVGWERKTLGDVVLPIESIDPTKAPAKSFRYVDVSSVSNETFEIVESSELLGKDAPSRARRKIRTGDVIFATIRPTLKRIAIVPQELDGEVCSTGYFVFRAKPFLDGRYLFYWLLTDKFFDSMERLQTGASYPAVNDTQVRQQEIVYPPLPEQQRIVAILNEAFAGLATATANAEKNLKNVQELFESYLRSVFVRRGTAWVDRSVSEVADHCLGKMLDRNKNRGEPQPYLRNLNVRWFDFDLSDVLEMRFEGDEISRYSAIKGDLLICEGGYPGRAAIWERDEPIFFQKAIHRVRFHAPWLTKWFLYFLYIQDATGELRSHFTGAGIQHFTGQALAKFKLPIPSEVEVRKHVAKFDELAIQTSSLEKAFVQKLEKIGELKQSILQKAFSGELTSPRAIKEAAE